MAGDACRYDVESNDFVPPHLTDESSSSPTFHDRQRFFMAAAAAAAADPAAAYKRDAPSIQAKLRSRNPKEKLK
jgi:hypothetical protein